MGVQRKKIRRMEIYSESNDPKLCHIVDKNFFYTADFPSRTAVDIIEIADKLEFHRRQGCDLLFS